METWADSEMRDDSPSPSRSNPAVVYTNTKHAPTGGLFQQATTTNHNKPCWAKQYRVIGTGFIFSHTFANFLAHMQSYACN